MKERPILFSAPMVRALLEVRKTQTRRDEFIPIVNSVVAVDQWHVLYHYADKKGAKVPSIHMPRWASRIPLEITWVRVERLQDISEADAIAEGIDNTMSADAVFKAPSRNHLLPSAVHGYAHLWKTMNGPGSWDLNPWVWVIEFSRMP